MAYKDKNRMVQHNNDYNRGAYDRIGIMAPKEEGKAIRAAAAKAGKSLNDFFLTAVREKMSRDAAKKSGDPD